MSTLINETIITVKDIEDGKIKTIQIVEPFTKQTLIEALRKLADSL